MTNPRKQEAKQVIDFAREQGAQGLIQTLLFSDRAIRYTLQKKTKQAQKLKQSLIDIINGVDPLAQLHQKSVDAQMDSIPPKAEHGFLVVAMKASANMSYQIAAIKYLTPFIEQDNDVFETIWEAANGKKSNMANVSDAAINALAYKNPQRKKDLKKIATNAQIDQYVRWNAHKILAFYDLTRDKSIYDLVCDLAYDHSILDLYTVEGIMSPNVKFWYESETRLRKEFPEQHKDGKTDEQIKQDVVGKVQKEFQEGIFEVIGYVMDNRDLHNDFVYPFMDEPDHGNFQRFDSSRLTTRMCNLLQQRPSQRVQVLCKYWKLPIPKTEVEQIRTTLLALKNDRWVYSSYEDLINRTLNDIEYKCLSHQQRKSKSQ